MSHASTARLRGGFTAVALAAALALGAPGAQAQSGGDGLLWVATYGSEIQVVRESDFSVVSRIPTQAAIPGLLTPSADGTRVFAQSIDYEYIEIFDAQARRSVDWFTLSERNTKVRIRSIAVHPDGRHMVLMLRRYEKLRDRWDVGEMELVLFDVQEKQVVRSIDWPRGEVQETASFGYSPDGEHLYFFQNQVHVYDTENYTEVDRWDYSGALGDGLGSFRFGFGATPREETGWHQGFFRMREPIQNRDVLGVARANPTTRAVEFTLLGPADLGPTSGFALSPDRRRAYAMHQEIGNYQLWSIDLQSKAMQRVFFPGRPRMSLEVSSNGRLLYIYAAGNTIDVYDAQTLALRRTVALDGDMTIGRLLIMPAR